VRTFNMKDEESVAKSNQMVNMALLSKNCSVEK